MTTYRAMNLDALRDRVDARIGAEIEQAATDGDTHTTALLQRARLENALQGFTYHRSEGKN